MSVIKIQPSITARDSYALIKYFSEIGRTRLVTADEEVLLTQKINCGDKAALEKLAEANLRFVISVAKQYQNNGLALDDLINEGNIGLIIAAKRFDPTKGFKFISYAVWWIRQTIQLAIAEQSRIVRLPMNQIACLNKMYKSTAKLEQQLERKPTPDELAEEMDLPVDKIAESIACSRSHVSIDAPLHFDERSSLLDILHSNELTTDDSLAVESRTHDINLLLNRLTERERRVITLLFGLDRETPHTLDEVAELFKLNRMTIRRIRDRALMRLKEYSKVYLLQPYL